jgi:4-oxalmesaconate hydratase
VQPQLKFQRERGSDLTIFSPRASGMAHHVGTEAVGREWARGQQRPHPSHLHAAPRQLRAVGQLPQFPGAPVENCIPSSSASWDWASSA